MPENVTIAGNVRPLSEVIECERLKARDGSPVRVLCTAVNELKLHAIIQTLPQAVTATDDAGLAALRALEWQEQLRRFGYPIVVAGAFLLDEGGKPRVPSFSLEPADGLLWLESMPTADAGKLFTTIMRLSGWIGGPADELSFPADAGGRPDGAGTVDAGEGERDAAERPAAGPEEAGG